MQISDPAVLQFEQSLRTHGLRSTHVRRALFAVLLDAHKPLSIQAIVRRLDGAHFVSVYRSVDALLKAGLIKQVPQGFKNRYELSDDFKPHHHHVSCESCGHSIEVNDKRIETLMHEITEEAGFAHSKHHFEMYGLCARCQVNH